MAADRQASLLWSAPGRQMRAVVSSPRGRIVVLHDLDAVREPWLHLQETAPASPYQTWDWLAAWVEAEGTPAGITPMIALAYDAAGHPIALLPFGLRRVGPVRTGIFLGGKHSNYNMGLFAPGHAWTTSDVIDLLRRAAAALPFRLDVYALTNQPYEWNGVSNPLALLKGQPSPSSSHRTDLPADPEAFFRANLSAQSRKKMRSKLSSLGALGPVAYRVARDPDEIAAVLAAFVEQKSSRLEAMGTADALEPRAMLPFFERAALPGPRGPGLELHALYCGDRIVSTFGGVAHAGRFSGMLISYDADTVVARNSPGELLLAAVVDAKCREGFSSFDLGIGEARYKQNFCPVVDPLFDSFLPLTVLGRLYTMGESLRLVAKSRIKQSSPIWALSQKVARLRRAVRSSLPR